MSIYDVYDRRVSTTALKREQAVVGEVRHTYTVHPAAGLTPDRLAAVLRNSINGDPETYLALAEDMEEREPHYAGVLGTRKRQVAQLELTVEAAGEDEQSLNAAQLVRDGLNNGGFKNVKTDVLDAIGKGFSCTEIDWDTSEKQWMPKMFNWIDPRLFQFDDETGKIPLLRKKGGVEPLNPYGWIFHCSKMKSGLPIRGGLARGVAWLFLFKSFTVKDWAIFCEAYGQPMRLGKYGSGASDEDKAKLLEAVSNIGADFSAIIPESMVIEFIQAKISGSHELYEKRSDWLDRQTSKLVLGQTATTDAIAGGHAVGKTHDGVREDIERADADQLQATLTRDFAVPIVTLNMGPQKRYPEIIIGRPDEVDVEKLVTNVVKLVPLGLEVSMDVMRDKVGLPAPTKGEKLLVSSNRAPNDNDNQDLEKIKAALSAQSVLNAMGKRDDVSQAITSILGGGGWEPLIGPMIEGLDQELATATTLDDARAILNARLESLGVEEFTNQLARATFATRLAGEVDEVI